MACRRFGWSSLRKLALALALTTAALEGTASAQAPGDEATRVSARQLGDEGTKLFDAGDYAGALDRFQRADALVPRQTLGLRVARCLVKLGRLNQAYERYVAVARMPVAAGLEPDVVALQTDAKTKAEAEGAALSGRIPSLVIEVKNAAAQASVTIDGAVVPAALLGVKRAVDPGSHTVVATSGGNTLTRAVVIKEGETLPVVLSFEPGAASAVPVGPIAAPPPPVAAPVAPPTPDAPRSSAQRVSGIALLALGGVGIVVGAGAGGAAIAQKSTLSGTCGSNLQCMPAQWSDADAYNRLRTISTVGLTAGAGLAVLGGVLLLTAPKSAPPPAPSAALWIGPRGMGVRGAF